MAATRSIPFHALIPDTPDADLLRRFIDGRDEPAFAELVRRHGPAVYRVCRRLLGAANADDAFQATFLVMACKAGRVRKAGSVGSWLVGVAGRVARQMRRKELASGLRQRAGSSTGPDLPAHADRSPELADLAAVLDAELARLPDHLRGPVVVCLIQGRTQEQAVAELGGSVRTVRRRLDEAKRLLRERLVRRGVVPAVAAGLVAGAGGAAAVPADLGRRTVALVFDFLAGGAVTTPPAVLAKGVATTMFARKVTMAVVSAAVGLTALGVGLAEEPTSRPPAMPGTAPPPVAPAPQAGGQPRVDPAVSNLRAPSPPAAITHDGIAVGGPTTAACRALHNEAVFQRRELARLWLGKEPPHLGFELKIKYAPTDQPRSSTTFTFANNRLVSAEISLFGVLQATLENGLPRQMTHVLLAAHFGKAIPLWASGGMATTAESPQEQSQDDSRCRNILNQGRGLRLKHLFPLTQYPADGNVPAIQGYTVVKFLVGKRGEPGVPVLDRTPFIDRLFKLDGHTRFVAFVELGLKDGWDKAAKDVYGFADVDELEQKWIDSLRVLGGKAEVDTTRIPPLTFEK